MPTHHQVLIIGGGTTGIMVASQLVAGYTKSFIPVRKLKQMLISDSSKEHWRLWTLKKYMLPYLYWNKMTRGQDV